MEQLLEILLTNPETASALIHEYAEKYKPAIYAVGKEMLTVFDDLSKNKEFFKVKARIRKNQFDAYCAAGFSEDQAMALLLNDNLQLMKNFQQSVQQAHNK